MVNILVIGAGGEGKSEWVKQFIEGKNCLVNDVQNEYGNRAKYPNQKPINLSIDTSRNRSRYIGGDFLEYVDIVKTKRKTVCVFEEATIFLQGAIGKDVRAIMTNRIFTENVYIFLFHSINSVPPRIMELINFVILYKTNDEEKAIERKFPRLLPYYRKLRESEKGSHFKIKYI